MTTFAKRTFDAANYLRYRPTYPSSLISHVLQYAAPVKDAVALDLGCGPGQATVLLAASGRFSQVIGMDPSQGMIEAAQATLKSGISPLLGDSATEQSINAAKQSSMNYVQGSAENLSHLNANSIDLVTAGQAAHWFNHEKAYSELARVLKPGGTVAYWGYAYMFLPEAPEVSQKILDLGTKKLKTYWEPGREGPESLYDSLEFPITPDWDADSFQRYKFDTTPSKAYAPTAGDLPPPPETIHHSVSMAKRMSKEDLVNSLKTWSSVHNYTEQHPDSENIIDSFYREVKDTLPSEEPLEVQWPIGMLLMKKKKQA